MITNQSLPKENLAALMFTSGSTGTPKAVMISQENIIANTESIINFLSIKDSDKIFTSLPLHYCFGASLLHTHLRAGGTIVFNSFKNTKPMLDYMFNSGANALAGVPSFFQILLRNSITLKHDFSSIKKIQQAGGKLASIFVKELDDLFSEAEVFLMYGQTEATARLSYLPPDMIYKKLGSIGKGIPGCQLKIQITNRVEDSKAIGEILAKGANVSLGYWQENNKNNKLFTDDGWLRTGDLGYKDKDGYIFIVGREKSFIKSGGHRCSSLMIEDYLLQHADIIEVGIVGIPDQIRGEAICAFIVAKEFVKLTKKEVITFCKQQLPRYMIPKHISFLEELPKNDAGKILKSFLKELSIATFSNEYRMLTLKK